MSTMLRNIQSLGRNNTQTARFSPYQTSSSFMANASVCKCKLIYDGTKSEKTPVYMEVSWHLRELVVQYLNC
jgi:hypothetical protein